ncbi:hypothetical protein [Dongia sp.]|uniref:hypothetical protein n=1 Tax=Dongia sp. TaxID=1977262 RepID=UPI0035AE00E9
MRGMIGKTAAIATLALAATMAIASHADEPVADEGAITDTAEIEAILSGHTMLGYFQYRGEAKDRWTEYHCPNGQSRYIHGTDFLRGVWRVGNGRVCYTYDRPNPGEMYCFQLFKDAAGLYKLRDADHPADDFTVFISESLPGDPFKLQKLDGGSCENLSS